MAQGGVAGSLTARLSQKGMAWPWGSRLTKGAWQGPNLPKRALRGFSSFDWPKGVWHGSGCSDCPKEAWLGMVGPDGHQGAWHGVGVPINPRGVAGWWVPIVTKGGVIAGVPIGTMGCGSTPGCDWFKGEWCGPDWSKGVWHVIRCSA